MRVRRRKYKWCHVTVTTHKHREVFKIAATARFCERALQQTCADQGWLVDTLVVRPHTIHALLRVPLRASRKAVVRQLKRAAAVAARQRPVCDLGKRVFAAQHWCAVVTDGAKVAALRQHLQDRADGRFLSTPEASAPP